MRRVILVLAVACGLAACFVSFDPAGQPCDAKGQCLSGYTCDATRHCVKGAATGTTGVTTGGGTSSGSGGSTGGTTTGTQDCSALGCPIAQACEVTDGGGHACVARVLDGGILCTSDAACGSGLCARSAAAGATGFCTDLCTQGAATCPQGESCQTVTGVRGNTASICVPTPSPRACTGAGGCGAGLGCQELDDRGGSPTPAVFPELPFGFCDTPPAGSALGSPCVSDAACASGLCAEVGDGGSACLALCASAADCGGTGQCLAVRHAVTGRHTRACVSRPTGCGVCGACGPDAPDCDTVTATCVLQCTGSDTQLCGGVRSCVFEANGVAYCAIDGGACP